MLKKSEKKFGIISLNIKKLFDKRGKSDILGKFANYTNFITEPLQLNNDLQ